MIAQSTLGPYTGLVCVLARKCYMRLEWHIWQHSLYSGSFTNVTDTKSFGIVLQS